jgi:hypothetical protein
MVALFANTLKAPYYEHMMGSLAQQFIDVVAVAERIEQGVKSGRISAPMEKKGFGVKNREIDHIESSYKSKKSQFQRYNTQSSSSQIANTNFNFPIPARKLEPQNHQVKNQAKSFPKKNYQRTQEQLPLLPLPLNEIYQKLLSIRQVAPVPLTLLQPPYPSWYKPDLTCEYHAGVAGHNIHTCNAFKRKLLQLIKAG